MTMTLPEVRVSEDHEEPLPNWDAIVAKLGEPPIFVIPTDPEVEWMDEVEKLAQEAAEAIAVPSGPLEGSQDPIPVHPDVPRVDDGTTEAWAVRELEGILTGIGYYDLAEAETTEEEFDEQWPDAEPVVLDGEAEDRTGEDALEVTNDEG